MISELTLGPLRGRDTPRTPRGGSVGPPPWFSLSLHVYTKVGYVWIGLSEVYKKHAKHFDFVDDRCHGNQFSLATG